MSFRLKTVIGIALIQTAFFVFLIIMMMRFVENAQDREIQERANTTINMFAATTRDAILASDLATLDDAAAELLLNPGIVYVHIIDANRQTMTYVGSEEDQTRAFKADGSLKQAITDGIYDIQTSISIAGSTLGIIQLGLSIENQQHDIQLIQNYGFTVAAVEIALMILFSFLLGNWLTRRLIKLKAAAESIGEGKLDVRLNVQGNDEIAHTISAFNTMSNKLSVAEKNHQQAMHKLELAEEHSRLLLTSAIEGIFGIDENCQISFANPAAAYMLAYDKPESMTGIAINDIFRQKPELIKNICKCIENAQVLHVEDTEFPGRDNSHIQVEFTCSPIIKDKQIHGAVIIFNDIGKRKEADAAILRAHQTSLEHAQAKADFMSNMSHELRTPMNGVIGLLQLIDKSKIPESYIEYISMAQLSANKLLKLINNILDYSRIDSDKVKISQIDFNLYECVEDCIDNHRSEAEKKGLKLNYRYETSLRWLKGDPQRLTQILDNLIDNAIKFTHKGEINISVKPLEITEDFLSLQFSVKDTGIGISAKNINKLFGAFSQVDTSMTREFGGIGIGLSICQSLVRKMGGSMHVKSRLDEGAEFTFAIQFMTSHIIENDQPLQTTTSTTKRYHGHVLLVDDNPVNQVVSRKVCDRFGLTYEQANNGQEAFELYKKGKFDLIFMDLQMPVLNGLEATRLIREQETSNSHQIIIALTANTGDDDRRQCLQVGVDDFLCKPLKVSDMEQVLDRWITSSPTLANQDI